MDDLQRTRDDCCNRRNCAQFCTTQSSISPIVSCLQLCYFRKRTQKAKLNELNTEASVCAQRWTLTEVETHEIRFYWLYFIKRVLQRSSDGTSLDSTWCPPAMYILFSWITRVGHWRASGMHSPWKPMLASSHKNYEFHLVMLKSPHFYPKTSVQTFILIIVKFEKSFKSKEEPEASKQKCLHTVVQANSADNGRCRRISIRTSHGKSLNVRVGCHSIFSTSIRCIDDGDKYKEEEWDERVFFFENCRQVQVGKVTRTTSMCRGQEPS